MELRRRQLFAKSAEISTIVFDKNISGPGSIYGDVNKGIIATVLSKWRRCLCRTISEREVAIAFLQNDNSNFYEDGTPAILTGEEGDVMVYKPEFYYKHRSLLTPPVIDITNTPLISVEGPVWIKNLDNSFDSPISPQTSTTTSRINFTVLAGITSLKITLVTSSKNRSSVYCGDLDSTSELKNYNFLYVQGSSRRTSGVMDVTPGNHFLYFGTRDSKTTDIGLCTITIEEFMENNSVFSYSISETEVDNTWIRSPESLIGAAKGFVKNDRMYSIFGVKPSGGIQQNKLSEKAFRRGSGYQLIGYEQNCMIAMLFYAKYGSEDSQSILGTGGGSYTENTGYTASFGNVDTQGEKIGYTNFLGIEGVHEGLCEIMSEVTASYVDMTITRLDGTITKAVTSNDDGWITDILASKGPCFDVIPTFTTSKYANSRYKDYFRIPNQMFEYSVRRGSDQSNSATCGIAYTAINLHILNSYDEIGSRLAFRGTVNQLPPSEFKKVPTIGAYILATDNTLVKRVDWVSSGKIAVGIAVLDDKYRFIIALEQSDFISWGGYNIDITTLTSFTSGSEAFADFDGKSNMDKIITAIGSLSAPAANYCKTYSYQNKSIGTWYLPSLGQLDLINKNNTEINACLAVVDGTSLDDVYYWSSTNNSFSKAWLLNLLSSQADIDNKDRKFRVRAVSTL